MNERGFLNPQSKIICIPWDQQFFYVELCQKGGSLILSHRMCYGNLMGEARKASEPINPKYTGSLYKRTGEQGNYVLIGCDTESVNCSNLLFS